MKWFHYILNQTLKKVSLGLNSIGIESYCPTFKTIKQYSDRKKGRKNSSSGLCVGYLEDHERNLVFSVPGIIRYIFWLGKPAEIRPFEIDNMKKS